MKVTPEQVKAAMIDNDIQQVSVRECSICSYPLAYVRHGEDLFFDPGCDCSRRRAPEHRSWNDAADLINMQNEEWSLKIAALFGIHAQTATEPKE